MNDEIGLFRKYMRMIWTLFFYGMVTGLIIEFLLTPEDKMIIIPRKVFWALIMIIFIGAFWRK